MNTTQINQGNISNIQSENSQNQPKDKFEFNSEAWISLESGGYSWEECVKWWQERYKLLTK